MRNFKLIYLVEADRFHLAGDSLPLERVPIICAAHSCGHSVVIKLSNFRCTRINLFGVLGCLDLDDPLQLIIILHVLLRVHIDDAQGKHHVVRVNMMRPIDLRLILHMSLNVI